LPWEARMTVVQHDWVSANRFSPERSGPEVYAPPDRRTIEQLSNAGHIAPLHRQTNEAGQADALIQGMAGTLMDEIDGIIRELERLGECLRSEAERFNQALGRSTARQFVGSLDQAAPCAFRFLRHVRRPATSMPSLWTIRSCEQFYTDSSLEI
jgi:hypothetical protein